MGCDESHPSHVGSESVDMTDVSSSLKRCVRSPEVEKLELVGVGIAVFWILQIDPTHPVTLLLESCDQVVADEAARPCNASPFHVIPLHFKRPRHPATLAGLGSATAFTRLGN